MGAAKLDRKAAMRATLNQPRPSAIDARFERADALLQGAVVEEGASSYHMTERDSKIYITAPLACVHENPLNARHIYKPEVIKERATSIATDGQMTPALAMPHPSIPGHYVLIDGLYRKKALQSLGRSDMELQLCDTMEGLALYKRSWLLNDQRSGQSAIDNALAWGQLIDDGFVADAEQIAELLALSPSTVSKTLSLFKLPAAAIDRIRQSPESFGVFIIYELSLAAPEMSEEDLLRFIDKVVAEKLSSRDVAALRQQIVKREVRKKKEVSRQYRIRSISNAVIGSLKTWDSGKVAFECILDDEADRESLIAELKQRFGLKD